MIRRSHSPALLALLILAGCGGQSDTSAPAATSSVTATRAQTLLATPLTNEAARAAQEGDRATGIGTLQQQHARLADGAPLTVDTGDRESVRLFFNRIYNETAAPIGWTGSHALGVPGATSAAFKAATLQRVNWYRAMAGLPAAVRLSEANSAKAQQAALMMSVAGQLSHTPTPAWRFYTADGAAAAGASNLALGSTGRDAVDQYMRDAGDGNGAAGHRRWILHPNTLTTATGDVPGGVMEGRQLMPANALWTTDVDFSAPRAPVRDDFVAWPAKGFVPYATVFQRWSLSYPNADFRQAKIVVTRGGVAVKTSLEAVADGYGENTLVWKMADIGEWDNHARPAADVRYRVSVSNVKVAQRARSFDYEVTVFDPAVATPGAALPVLSAPAQATVGLPYTARIGALPGATGYRLDALLATPLTGTQAAPFDAVTWTGANGGTHAIVEGGKLRFYVTPTEWNPQSATLNKSLFVGSAASKVMVNRSIGWATSTQTFRVQASLDDGRTWTDLHRETGRDGAPAAGGVVQASLAAYVGQTIRLRMAADASGAAYHGAGTGWTVNSVAFEDVQELGERNAYRSAGGDFTFSFARPGNWILTPRAELHGLYDSDPGAALVVRVDGGNQR